MGVFSHRQLIDPPGRKTAPVGIWSLIKVLEIVLHQLSLFPLQVEENMALTPSAQVPITFSDNEMILSDAPWVASPGGLRAVDFDFLSGTQALCSAPPCVFYFVLTSSLHSGLDPVCRWEDWGLGRWSVSASVQESELVVSTEPADPGALAFLPCICLHLPKKPLPSWYLLSSHCLWFKWRDKVQTYEKLNNYQCKTTRDVTRLYMRRCQMSGTGSGLRII